MLKENSPPEATTAAPKPARCKRADTIQPEEITLIARTAQAAITGARTFAGDAEITEVALAKRGVGDAHLWRVRYGGGG
ncbi:MAG: hypothetical protein V3W41_09340 [Planctomycetota bacterium]